MDIAELKAELEKLHSSSFGWALSCCRHDRGEAEEVLQTVYLKILEGQARFRGESSFRTWLFAVIHKTAAGERRKNLLRKLRLVRESQAESDGIAPADRPDVAAERSETQAQFLRALEQLPGRQRQTLHLVFYQDLSLREAADVMGVSVGSARRHYERGKKRLREFLGEAEISYGVKWGGEKNPSVVS
ncbi:MAG: RNA polymerase sigma factor [Pyrinomonadaceae bacterium]